MILVTGVDHTYLGNILVLSGKGFMCIELSEKLMSYIKGMKCSILSSHHTADLVKLVPTTRVFSAPNLLPLNSDRTTSTVSLPIEFSTVQLKQHVKCTGNNNSINISVCRVKYRFKLLWNHIT
jgi:hypothetical protein